MAKGKKPTYRPADKAVAPQLENISKYLSKPPAAGYSPPKKKGK